MKTRLRNIVVDNQNFVYWYSSGKLFKLNFSPKNDKNLKIELVFEVPPPVEEQYTFSVFYEISAIKNSAETTISIAKPKFIADVISYLLSTQKELFIKGKTHVVNAMELLKKMGYSELKPIWIEEW